MCVYLFVVSQISDISPVGTIAYLYEEESLLVRVRKGWQYISVSLSLSGPARNKMRSTFTVTFNSEFIGV
jgi:hypothetical protein